MIGNRTTILLAALLAALLLSLGFARAWPLSLDLGGGRDARFVDGFHAPEQLGPTTVRWTTDEASVRLPRPPLAAPALLRVGLLNARPDGAPVPQVTLSLDGRELLRQPVQGARVYQILAPTGWSAARDVTLTIGSETISTPNDPRPLGIALDRVGLTPVGAAPWPSVWLLGCGLLLGGLGAALALLLGARRWLALLLPTLLAAALALGFALRPLETLPFAQRFPLLLGVALLGVGLVRTRTRTQHAASLWPRREHASLHAEPGERGGAADATGARGGVVNAANRGGAGEAFPAGGFWPGADDARGMLRPYGNGIGALVFALAVAWWLGPLVQLGLTLDGATGVTPAPVTLYIGAGLLLALAVLLIAQRWSTVGGQTAAVNPILLLFALAALAHLAYTLWFAFTRNGPDFWILFKGAREWVRGGSMYDLAAITENHFGHVFKVPPFYGMLFAPFVFRDGFEILFYHRLLNTLLLTLAVLAWFRMFRLAPWSVAGLGTIILLSFRPFADTIAYGQIDLALLLCLVLALWALRAERDLLAGVLVALGTLFKVYPVLLLAFFVAKRQWRALLGFALGMLIFNGAAIAVVGWEMHRVYLFEVLPRIGGTTAWVENQTLSGFLARFFAAPGDATILPLPNIARLGLLLGGVLGLLGCALALPPVERRSTAFALQYGQFLLLMVLVVPAAWMHYETLLFVPFAALLLHLNRRDLSVGRLGAVALAFALIAYGNQWSYFDGTVMGVLTALAVSYKFYGMLLLGGVLVAELLPGLVAWWRAARFTTEGAEDAERRTAIRL